MKKERVLKRNRKRKLFCFRISLSLIKPSGTKTLVPKFPTKKIKNPIISEDKNLNQFPPNKPLSLAKVSLSKPTLSGESIMEWINQKGEKSKTCVPMLKFKRYKIVEIAEPTTNINRWVKERLKSPNIKNVARIKT